MSAWDRWAVFVRGVNGEGDIYGVYDLIAALATTRQALAEARKTLEVIEEPMHFDDIDAIRDDRLRMQTAARAWLVKDRRAPEAPDRAAMQDAEAGLVAAVRQVNSE